jgi:hypothetical protein
MQPTQYNKRGDKNVIIGAIKSMKSSIRMNILKVKKRKIILT